MANCNDTSNMSVNATYNERLDAADAHGFAVIATSWAVDRILPMVRALVALSSFESPDAWTCNRRLELIRDIANEAESIADNMAGYFESEVATLSEKLAQLAGGVP